MWILLIFACLFLFINPLTVLAIAPPEASIEIVGGATTVSPGGSITFNVSSTGTNLTGMEVFRAKVDPNLDLSLESSFALVGQTIACSDTSCSGQASWIPTASEEGQWHVVVNAYSDWNPPNGRSDDNDENCSGNPSYLRPGWHDCGRLGLVDSLIITVSQAPTGPQNQSPAVLGLECINELCSAVASDPDFYLDDPSVAPPWKEIVAYEWTVDGTPYQEIASSQSTNTHSSVAGVQTGSGTTYQSMKIPPNYSVIGLSVVDAAGARSDTALYYSSNYIAASKRDGVGYVINLRNYSMEPNKNFLLQNPNYQGIRETDIDLIINRSRGEFYNPAFVLSVWMTESKVGLLPGPALGCDPNHIFSYGDGLQGQLDCFFDTHRFTNDFTVWLDNHCGPKITVICNNDGNQVYPYNIRSNYRALLNEPYISSTISDLTTGGLFQPWLCWASKEPPTQCSGCNSAKTVAPDCGCLPSTIAEEECRKL